MSCFCGEGTKSWTSVVPKTRYSMTKRSVGEFESKSEFKMSQTNRYRTKCGACDSMFTGLGVAASSVALFTVSTDELVATYPDAGDTVFTVVGVASWPGDESAGRKKKLRIIVLLQFNKFHSDKETSLINNCNLGSFFKYVNSKISYISGVAPLQDTAGNLHNSDADKAQLLNDHFPTVFVQDDGKLRPFSRDETKSLPNASSVFLQPWQCLNFFIRNSKVKVVVV